MHALPSIVALLSAALLAPAVLRALRDGGHTRPNYRGCELPWPVGVLVLAAVPLALIPLTLVQQLASANVFEPQALPVAVYALGVVALGLLDDGFGSAAGQPRGWRGHGGALLRGRLTTGGLKALGALGLALFATAGLGLSHARWLLAAGVLVLATNVFNLLDLRPGRSLKAFVLLGAGLTAGARELRPLWALGLFAAPALIAGVYDLRERAMLGDTGASLLGALAGLWIVLTLSGVGQLIALLVLAIITLYGEIRSISALVERVPALRELDSWGRPS
jgi:UDP-N-acetylmuramyl pentapeptide phosphotransferase/UDP-N-acetylglucosamine-1-phosphate transferase